MDGPKELTREGPRGEQAGQLCEAPRDGGSRL